ncbi:MAG: hypothetical protein L0206_13235 [Actinobacteria bacterium]|nr:hypothetical protein [Actinomycetota bacterium]
MTARLAFLAMLLGCNDPVRLGTLPEDEVSDAGGDDGTDTATGSDSDTDTDADSDTDVDSDADTDSETVTECAPTKPAVIGRCPPGDYLLCVAEQVCYDRGVCHVCCGETCLGSAS